MRQKPKAGERAITPHIYQPIVQSMAIDGRKMLRILEMCRTCGRTADHRLHWSVSDLDFARTVNVLIEG